jgi:hypothetical protein
MSCSLLLRVHPTLCSQFIMLHLKNDLDIPEMRSSRARI